MDFFVGCWIAYLVFIIEGGGRLEFGDDVCFVVICEIKWGFLW